MARILVNYIYDKAKDKFEIQKGCFVFADMKVAVYETEEEIYEPLVVPIRNVMTVVDRERYEKVNKKFKLVADNNGNVCENEDGVEVWLPKDTDLKKLKYINGQLVLAQDEEKVEKKETKKTKV